MSEPTRVRPPVELDALSAAELDGELARCDPEGITVIELGHVELCDSAGLRVLVVHAMRHLHAGGELRVLDPRPHVRWVFGIAGVATLLGVEP